MDDNLINATVGMGGGAYLIIGEEKTALLDTGMAYCGGDQVSMVKGLLAEYDKRAEGRVQRKLDLILLSHSHYDHVGGIGFLRETWPELKVYGAAYAKKILAKPSAIRLIRELSQNAKLSFGTCEEVAENEKYGKSAGETLFLDEEHLKVDTVIGEGDVIDLGRTRINVMETSGHTRCSLSYHLPVEETLFPSESTGVLTDVTEVKPSILVSYRESMKSWERCSAIPAKRIISSHANEVRPENIKYFWDWCLNSAELSKKIILDCYQNGLGREAMLSAYRKTFRKGFLVVQQPIEAFDINANASIDVILREFTEGSLG